jgi:hypothetical protein
LSADEPLESIWGDGYSIPELWGFTAPVTRATSAINDEHYLIWGILSIVEYQVDRGAGHRYLRDRLWAGDWIAIGFEDAETESSELVIVPKIVDAKFGRKQSAVGDFDKRYVNVRIIHALFMT